ncbi:MAG TPA: hypothetical protein DHN33_01285, partial [Eubacteriaceae bacterium]|nr:hypothetical protein [Eubacteriaceae bacterium]
MKRNLGSILFGLILLAIGGVLLTNNFGITDINVFYYIFRFWPVVFILIGLGFLSSHGSFGENLSGIIFILIGGILLGNTLNLFNVNIGMIFQLFWPTVLILAGAMILFGRKSQGKSNVAFMGAVERTKGPWTLEENSFVAIMGGIELDFTLADLPEGETVIDLTAFMGGIELFVPDHIEVRCKGTALLGGVELLDRETGGIIASTEAHHTPAQPSKTVLKIYSRAIMGGIDVKL